MTGRRQHPPLCGVALLQEDPGNTEAWSSLYSRLVPGAFDTGTPTEELKSCMNCLCLF